MSCVHYLVDHTFYEFSNPFIFNLLMQLKGSVQKIDRNDGHINSTEKCVDTYNKPQEKSLLSTSLFFFLQFQHFFKGIKRQRNKIPIKIFFYKVAYRHVIFRLHYTSMHWIVSTGRIRRPDDDGIVELKVR